MIHDHPWSIIFWLVVSTPLKNMSSSVGMMKFPIYGKSYSSHVPVTTNQFWLKYPLGHQIGINPMPQSSWDHPGPLEFTKKVLSGEWSRFCFGQ
jgi:hypothetical protein